MQDRGRSYLNITTFLVLTFMLGAPLHALILTAEDPVSTARSYGLLLMWSPGIAAILTRLIYQKNLRHMGWGWGKTRYQALGYALPVLLLSLLYVPLWLSGLAEFSSDDLTARIAEEAGQDTLSLPLTLLIQASIGFVLCLIDATGEELGWRGFLVPELAKRTSYTSTALVTGLIWAVWHWPLFFAGFERDVPLWQAMFCHTATAVGLSFMMTWLRLKSGSLWTCAIMHAASNLYLEGVFEPLTVDNKVTLLLADDFGFGVPIVYLLGALLFWRWRTHLPATKDGCETGDSRLPEA